MTDSIASENNDREPHYYYPYLIFATARSVPKPSNPSNSNACSPYPNPIIILQSNENMTVNGVNINQLMSSMARSGQLNIGGFGGGYPIKILAVIDGKTYEKDHSLFRPDVPFGILRKMLTSELPFLSEDEPDMYSLSWMADEIFAYQTFEVRRLSRKLENASNEEIDAIVKGMCVICQKKKNLKACSKCKHVQVKCLYH